MKVEAKLNKNELHSLRVYAKRLSYNIFLDKKEKKTCIYSKKTRKRVFVEKIGDNLVAVDDDNNKEVISFNVIAANEDLFRCINSKNKKLKNFLYGIISIS